MYLNVMGKYELRTAVKKLYQLRPKMTASSVSVESRVVNSKYDECVPRLVRNCISCIERHECTEVQQLEVSYSFIVLYFKHNYMHTYRIVE